MKRHGLCVIFLSFALIAGCSNGGSETVGNDGVSGGGGGTKVTRLGDSRP